MLTNVSLIDKLSVHFLSFIQVIHQHTAPCQSRPSHEGNIYFLKRCTGSKLHMFVFCVPGIRIRSETFCIRNQSFSKLWFSGSQKNLVIYYSQQCCGSGCLLFIPDPDFFRPEYRIRIFFIPVRIFFHLGSRIRIKKVKYFNPKNCFLSSRTYNPGCLFRIRILIFYPSRIQGSKRHQILNPDP
jgi:hypothetical protein